MSEKPSSSQVHACEVFCRKVSSSALKIIVLTWFLALGVSCKEELTTPSWRIQQSQESAETSPKKAPVNQAQDPLIDGIIPDYPKGTELRFVAYNLRNYLTMRRGKELKPKPEVEIGHIIQNIAKTKPDVLGLCEIGDMNDLENLQSRLKKAGHDLPFKYLTAGSDPVRSLAMLSRYPIRQHQSPLRSYFLGKTEFRVSRGFIDATIISPLGEVRMLGAHLKSKRPMQKFDQAVVRRHEALILRNRASEILSTENPPLLLVYGDMNDTKRSQAIRTIKGPNRGGNSLKIIELAAKDGTKWTQHWAAEDIYSRFDFAFASSKLLQKIDKKKSYVLDTPRGDKASDHRALVIVIK